LPKSTPDASPHELFQFEDRIKLPRARQFYGKLRLFSENRAFRPRIRQFPENAATSDRGASVAHRGWTGLSEAVLLGAKNSNVALLLDFMGT
jgi:hypothetical protein